MREQAGALRLPMHMDHLVADRVELRDRLAELLALAGVLLGGLVGALREPHRERGDRDPSAVERLHRLRPALALLAE